MNFPTLHEDAFGTEELYLHLEDVSIELPLQSRLQQVLINMAEQENAPFRELNYIFCSDDYLLEVNRQHLNHDYYTDVITFPHLEQSLCGDIYISTDRIAENAQNLGVSFDLELLRVMLHGALHLCGHTDTTPAAKQKMRKLEDQYLAVWHATE